ncbi:MAG: hypothetical protein V3U33_03140 [candidate division NC10 bacterium]
MAFGAHKVLTFEDAGPFPSSARVLDPPILVARAAGTSVVPEERQQPA